MIKRYKNIKTKRKARVRSRIYGTINRPRLTIFRSNKYLYAQIIDDDSGKTLVAANDASKTDTKTKTTKVERAQLTGTALAKKALKANIKKVSFDRGSSRYHGRVKAFAQAARGEGLEF